LGRGDRAESRARLACISDAMREAPEAAEVLPTVNGKRLSLIHISEPTRPY